MPDKPTSAQSAFYVLISLPTAGFGALLLAILGPSAIRDVRTYAWMDVPCTIVASAATDQARGVREFSATYAYDVGGRTYQSSRVTGPDPYHASDRAIVDRLVMAYPPGRRTTCYVDPAHPDQAVLQRPPILIYLITIPALLLVALPVALAFLLVRERTRPARTDVPAARAAGFGFFGAIAWGLIVVGAAIAYFLFVVPSLEIRRAQDWRATPCTVVSSALRTVSSTGSATRARAYRIDIEYEYLIGSQPFRGNRYDFWGADGLNVEGKRRIVAEHPSGAKTTCFVDPADPTQAVLDRSFNPWLMMRLLPLGFSAAGLVIWIALRRIDGVTP